MTFLIVSHHRFHTRTWNAIELLHGYNVGMRRTSCGGPVFLQAVVGGDQAWLDRPVPGLVAPRMRRAGSGKLLLTMVAKRLGCRNLIGAMIRRGGMAMGEGSKVVGLDRAI